jgi:holo-[acyl-carrier protein] synthase
MIAGTGIDIVEIARMREAIKKWGGNFTSKIFTPSEARYSTSKKFSEQHFAARFAAKEAVVKAFGEPNKFPIRWTDIEISNDEEGKPVIEFRGDALKLKKKKRIDDVIVSMSHSRDYAIASVILLRKR